MESGLSNSNTSGVSGTQNVWSELELLLQDYAPKSSVNVPHQEHVPTQVILQNGGLFVGNVISYHLMELQACHDNILYLYDRKKIRNMCIGYAMAEDRKWRYHSWGLGHTYNIIETTAPFLLYFGCVLVPK
jgi:hypothetical protein